MARALHLWLGLLFAIPVLVIALSGTILAVKPVMLANDAAVQPLAGLSAATVLQRVVDANPRLTVERLRVTASGIVLVKGKLGTRRVEKPLDVQTGTLLHPKKDSAFFTFVRDIHRTFLLGKMGRYISLTSAAMLAIMLVSGVVMLLRQLGGWRGALHKIRGRTPNRLHGVLGRVLIFPLIIVAVTGLYMGLVTQKTLPTGAELRPYYPETPNELAPVLPHELTGLKAQPLDGLRELLFPIPGDWFDVFALKTDAGFVFIDQFTGEVLSTTPYSGWQVALEWIAVLHTGVGAAPWAIILGITSLGVPVFLITGVLIWWRKRQPRIAQNARADVAEIVVMVGSQNGTTHGFAQHLHAKLVQAGAKVRLEEMNKAKPAYPKAQTMLVLAATYGDGAPPQNANRFIERITKARNWPDSQAVLGFGDRSFPQFCAFANQVGRALPGQALLPMGLIDRQSSQSFIAWGRALSQVIGLDFTLDHQPKRPKTAQLTLCERIHFGADISTPSAILRLRVTNGRLARYRAGDMIGIYAAPNAAPRIYSLGSSRRDGYVELCVAQQEGGLCSTYLNHLELGKSLEAYIIPNPGFVMPARKRPVLMIGAGTGIAPFAGMIRANTQNRAIDLFWGNRHPDSDFYYRDEISQWLADGRLTGFFPAFSRTTPSAYVQDQLTQKRDLLQARLCGGGTVMVCGSQKMATAVRTRIDALASHIGTSLAELRRQNRYLEDIY